MNKKSIALNDLVVFLWTFVIFLAGFLPWFLHGVSEEQNRCKTFMDDVQVTLQKANGYDEALSQAGPFQGFRLSYFSTADIPDKDSRGDYEKETSLATIQANVGRYYEEKAPSLGTTYCYSVTFDQSTSLYVRYGVTSSPSVPLARAFLIYGSLAIIAVDLGYFVFTIHAFDKAMLGLKSQIRRLQSLTDSAPAPSDLLAQDDLSYLTAMIRDSRKELDLQFREAKISAEKINFILDSFSQGLVVVDASFSIMMFNKKASEIFGESPAAVLGKPLSSLSKDPLAEKNITMVLKTLIPMVYYPKIDGRIYECDINPIDYSWAKVNEKNGASMLMIDVTDAYNSAQMKRDFFANASHELKSPLTSILGYQEMLKEGIITTPQEIADANAKTIKEAKRMQKILLDMLELSSLENQDLRTIEPINVRLAIEEIVGSLEIELKEKKITLDIEGGGLVVRINEDDLDRLLRNLIENAIRYNKEGGQIWIRINPKDKTIAVEDTGIGIAEEDRSRIFERFFRVDKARSRENGGTGLGLAIAKYIANYYDYTIEVLSSLGQGSTFIVHLK
jgi:two-component system phosphate regulon sensor histidine kinase PhoR